MSLFLKASSAIWMVVMAVLAAYGIYSQPIAIEHLLSRFDLMTSLAVFSLIIAGKIMTIYQVNLTLRASGEGRGAIFSWRAYSLADVSKYLPGGIWGIASRIGIYRSAGISFRDGTRILLVETALIILFSLLVGVALLLPVHRFGSPDGSLWIGRILIAACLAAATCVAFRRLGLLPALLATAILILAWLAFGLSFALVATNDPERWMEMAGVFDVGFATGQLAIFAPSGIGVREWVISQLSNVETGEQMRLLVELALAHRLIWIVADFALLLPVALLPLFERFRGVSTE